MGNRPTCIRGRGICFFVTSGGLSCPSGVGGPGSSLASLAVFFPLRRGTLPGFVRGRGAGRLPGRGTGMGVREPCRAGVGAVPSTPGLIPVGSPGCRRRTWAFLPLTLRIPRRLQKAALTGRNGPPCPCQTGSFRPGGFAGASVPWRGAFSPVKIFRPPGPRGDPYNVLKLRMTRTMPWG